MQARVSLCNMHADAALYRLSHCRLTRTQSVGRLAREGLNAWTNAAPLSTIQRPCSVGGRRHTPMPAPCAALGTCSMVHNGVFPGNVALAAAFGSSLIN